MWIYFSSFIDAKMRPKFYFQKQSSWIFFCSNLGIRLACPITYGIDSNANTKGVYG